MTGVHLFRPSLTGHQGAVVMLAVAAPWRSCLSIWLTRPVTSSRTLANVNRADRAVAVSAQVLAMTASWRRQDVSR